MHGFSEHINRYNDWFPKLNEHGIQVFGWDQRGWGRSVNKPAERGLTGPTSQVISEVAAFINDKLPSDVPVFVMGHSMGGGEVLTLASDPAYEKTINQVRGWILESPFIGFSPDDKPSSAKVFVGRLVGRLLPKQQMKHAVPPEHLTRDQEIVESYRNDPLCHNTGTLEGLASLLDRTAALSNGSRPVHSGVRSLLLTHGNGDKTCSFDEAMKYFNAQTVADKAAKPYEGAYHQLHNDHCKDEFTKDVVDWILERSQAGEPVQLESKL